MLVEKNLLNFENMHFNPILTDLDLYKPLKNFINILLEAIVVSILFSK